MRMRHGKASADILVAVGVIGIILIMIMTLTPTMLSILIALNIALSLIILLVSLYIKEPLDFSVFPSLLLFVTLFRLSLNISSTKLILGNGGQAGNVIEFFGIVVAGSNAVVGFVVFLILVIIQFIVITKGAGRVAEVAARFTLDAMPGKQMAIDADLNAGLINETEAKERRLKITNEADFYGAMDGASKFVRGDAIAGIIITVINIVGGIIIGFLMNESGGDISWTEVIKTYTIVTIGDGLSAQIPALLVATASGFVVTRTSGSDIAVGGELLKQFTAYPKALQMGAITCGGLGILGIFTQLPAVPFLVIGGVLGSFSYLIEKEQLAFGEKEEDIEEEDEGQQEEKVEDLLQVDVMELEIGYSLIGLVNKEKGGDLSHRIKMIRRQIAMELGFIVPPIRIRDNIQLQPNQYMIKIKNIEVGTGELYLGQFMAMNPGTAAKEIQGTPTKEPAFGLPAIWITEDKKMEAEMAGYTVVEAPAVLATHLTEIIKANATDLLGREDVQKLVDNLKERYPALVGEVIPSIISIGVLQKILHNLLSEQVSIKDMATILEVLGDYGTQTKNADVLTERVRQALSKSICQKYIDQNKNLYVVNLEKSLEDELQNNLKDSSFGMRIVVNPDLVNSVINQISNIIQSSKNLVEQPVILTNAVIRAPFKKLIEGTFSYIPVLSYHEIPKGINVQLLGTVKNAMRKVKR